MAVIRLSIYSQALAMQTNIKVILPTISYGDDYNTFYKKGLSYQSIILLHGGSGDENDYINLTNIVRYADDNKIAVIMPAGYNSFYTDDLNGLKGGGKYFTYISEELPLLISGLFPISNKREDCFVGGLSMGSVGAFKVAVTYPERFCGVLCMSGAGRGPYNPANNIQHTFLPHFAADSKRPIDDPWTYIRKQVKDGKQMPNFYLTCGKQDPIAYIDYKETVSLLKELNLNLFYEEVEGYSHEWPFWDISLKKALYNWLPIKRKV